VIVSFFYHQIDINAQQWAFINLPTVIYFLYFFFYCIIVFHANLSGFLLLLRRKMRTFEVILKQHIYFDTCQKCNFYFWRCWINHNNKSTCFRFATGVDMVPYASGSIENLQKNPGSTSGTVDFASGSILESNVRTIHCLFGYFIRNSTWSNLLLFFKFNSILHKSHCVLWTENCY
jgi:hypothetical protein